jgi:hypothetical protein
MATTDAPDRPLEDRSIEELKEGLRSGDLTLQDLRENDAVRQRLRRLIVKQDMEEHREIYDRLAQV